METMMNTTMSDSGITASYYVNIEGENDDIFWKREEKRGKKLRNQEREKSNEIGLLHRKQETHMHQIHNVK